MRKKVTKFNAEEKPYITSITLGGFQVFDEPTTIPLGKLTFLFGPNSAGKSAIEDGLALLLKQIDNDSEQLERHWRKVGSKLAPVLTMGITASTPVDLRARLNVPNKNIGPEYRAVGHEIGIIFKYRTEDGDERPNCWPAFFQMSVDGIPILELEHNKSIGVNFKHPILSGFVLVGSYELLRSEVPQLVSFLDDGWVRLITPIVYFEAGSIDRGNIWHEWKFDLIDSDPPKETWQIFSELLKVAENEVVDFFDALMAAAEHSIKISTDIVPASRAVPTQKELTFIFAESDQLLSFSDLFPEGERYYRDLALSCLAKRIGRTKRSQSAAFLSAVNRALSDHLFLERGYQIDAEFRAILDFDDVENLRSPKIGDIADDSCLVQIYLRDSHGMKQAFDQVGSGLGYVLPVLCSVANPSFKISMLQQPELHLHPALQAALGDVFIECSGDKHQLIIETHSEHLLLRVLKRIRQTTQGKLFVPELQLAQDDVVVVYFNPKPDGTTLVKRLRISEDGEFLDRWPRGFFTERDEELFDE